ncbi:MULTISPECIES: hypothetical protein [unclassified Paenibacillus]|uniref:hypothetical protein n=1 Tax=unclassified Paenibacillus TaxID=185978 RepID=UPI00215786DF|nr:MULTISPECIES: hypothetical protein [unclassified Paenibacillus]
MNTYRVLQADVEFLVAVLSQVRVSVWQIQADREQLIDYGGSVEGYSESSIKIMGGRYFPTALRIQSTKIE